VVAGVSGDTPLSVFGVPFVRGPKDVRDLPAHRAERSRLICRDDIEIIAEINHAPG
jgi:hypothetical protein